MAIRVIVEFTALPGRRDELRAVFEEVLAAQGDDLPGFLGSRRFERPDQPDVLVEIADWESPAARDAHLREAAATGAFGPLVELLAEPFRVDVLHLLD